MGTLRIAVLPGDLRSAARYLIDRIVFARPAALIRGHGDDHDFYTRWSANPPAHLHVRWPEGSLELQLAADSLRLRWTTPDGELLARLLADDPVWQPDWLTTLPVFLPAITA